MDYVFDWRIFILRVQSSENKFIFYSRLRIGLQGQSNKTCSNIIPKIEQSFQRVSAIKLPKIPQVVTQINHTSQDSLILSKQDSSKTDIRFSIQNMKSIVNYSLLKLNFSQAFPHKLKSKSHVDSTSSVNTKTLVQTLMFICMILNIEKGAAASYYTHPGTLSSELISRDFPKQEEPQILKIQQPAMTTFSTEIKQARECLKYSDHIWDETGNTVSGLRCEECPYGTHFYPKLEQCYQNITGCRIYHYGTASSQCLEYFSSSSNKNKLSNTLTTASQNHFFTQTNFSSTQFRSSLSNQNFDSVAVKEAESNNQYRWQGQSENSHSLIPGYELISIQEAMSDQHFLQCHRFMLTGEYKHFISRSEQPVQSVSTIRNPSQQQPTIREYKILYEGSGGNLLQCLISIRLSQQKQKEASSVYMSSFDFTSFDRKELNGASQTFSPKINLRSFVTIGRTQIIHDCVQYNSLIQCQACRRGYFLAKDPKGYRSRVSTAFACQRHIVGCLQYWGNICVKCRGFNLLIDNTCVSPLCEEVIDTRKITRQ